MNPHLMRAAGFQPTLDEPARPERLDQPHMSDGTLSIARRAAAASAVAAVADQPRLDAALGRQTADDRQIPPADRMSAELPAEMALRLRRPGEHDEPTRIAIDAVHGAQPTDSGDQPR